MTAPSSNQSPPSAAAFVSRWRSEPYRIFFPLGVLLAWIGVGQWLTFAAGLTATYPGRIHASIQLQAFMMAFAIGFLLTALPRRTQSPPPSRAELAAFAALLLATAGAALAERWALSELAYAGLFVMLFEFAIRRFAGGTARRNPPAAFVLLPIAALQGIFGAASIAAAGLSGAPAWAVPFGRLLVEQGVFLCLVAGVGGLVVPLIGGAPPPPDLARSSREKWKVLAYAAVGAAIFLGLLLEQLGFERSGSLLCAIAFSAGIGYGAGAWRLPAKPGVHRKLVWLSIWLMPISLIACAIWPAHRIAALHILFIGGFGLMAFSVGTHVALSHLNLEKLALGRPPAVIVMGVAFIAALLARLAADISPAYYFVCLEWAAGIWIFGAAVWLAFFGPKMLRR